MFVHAYQVCRYLLFCIISNEKLVSVNSPRKIKETKMIHNPILRVGPISQLEASETLQEECLAPRHDPQLEHNAKMQRLLGVDATFGQHVAPAPMPIRGRDIDLNLKTEHELVEAPTV